VSSVAEDMAARLARGEDLGSVAMAVFPRNVRETVKRCAAVTTFDAELYTQVLRSADGPELAELAGSGRVGQVPGTPERYQLESYLRDGGWQSWWADEGMTPGAPTVPPSLARYAEQLADYYRAVGQPLEELRALLLADPDRARELFLRLYAAADEQFDLARCQDAIDVLAADDRAHVLPVELARLRNDYQAFLSARSMWATEFHQTARYFSRPEAEGALRRLLAGKRSRVLQIVAAGGMGKTTQLRWFVARHCITRRPSIPCARIDFDVVDPVNALRYPWLLLLEIASQLDQQLPSVPFGQLVRDYERYRPLLSRGSAPVTASVDEGTAVDADEIVNRFCRTLAEARAFETPVVLLFDTMEEVGLRPDGGTAALVEMLGRVHTEARSARLVLSGRYDLKEQVAGFPGRLGKVATLQIKEFRPADAARYLSVIRGISRRDLVTAIVNKCGGLPFTLALFGDLAAQDPSLTSAAVESSTDPALLYCIARILERIDDDRLRWLLRYGVVPRRLTLSFLKEVIWPHLIRSIEGDEARDHPAEDARPPRSVQIFQQAAYPAPEDPQDMDRLWAVLSRYASQSSWVSEDRGTLTFHVRVRAPLRALLSAQPVFGLLHRDAISYFEWRAADQPDRWSRWMRDAIYHRFQLDQSDGAAAWRDAISRARAEGRTDWVKDLAGDLFSPDYLDDAGEPARSVAGDRVRYDAHVEIGRVSAEAARQAGDSLASQRWSTAQRHLGEADRLLTSPEITSPSTRHLILQATVALAFGPHAAAERYLGALAGGDLGGEDRRDVYLLQAESGALEGDPDTNRRFDAAFQASLELRDTAGATQIAADAAVRCLDGDQQEAALLWCERARAMHPAPQLAVKVVCTEATALLELGLPQRAVRRVFPDGTVRFTPDQSGEPAAEALLALGRPVDALRVLELAQTAEAPAQSGEWRRILLRGRAYGMLLRPGKATRLLERGLAASLGDMERALLTNELAVLNLRCTGDLDQAQHYLRDAERNRVPPGSAAWLEVQLTAMELQIRLTRPQAALDTLDTVLSQLSQTGARQRSVIRAAIRGLAITISSAQEQIAQFLLGGLGAVRFLSTPLGLLGDLRDCPALGDTAVRAALDQLLLRPWRAAREPELADLLDHAWADLAAVEIYRLLGRPGDAQATLDGAVGTLASADPLIWLEWIRASNRIGPPAADETEPPPDLLARYRAYPALSAAYLIELTERRQSIDPSSLSLQRLSDVTGLLARAEVSDVTGLLARAEDRKLPWRARLDALVDRLTEGPAATPPAASAGRPESAAPPSARSHEIPVPISASDLPWPDPLSDFGLIREMQEPGGSWAVQCGDLLAGRILSSLAEATPGTLPDVRLSLDLPSAAIPWEMARIYGQAIGQNPAVRFVYRSLPPVLGPPGDVSDRPIAEIRTLQRALQRLDLLGPSHTSGILDSRTRNELHDFQRDAGLPETDWPASATWQALRRILRNTRPPRRPRVLILQSDVGRSIRSGRGSQGSTADVQAIYSEFGLETSVLWNPTMSKAYDRLASAVAVDQIDVLHICAVVDTSGRRLALDFSGGSGGSDSAEAFPATGVGDLAQAVGPVTPPLVVLDVLAPPHETELIRQLLLRNTLGQQILGLGGVDVVLATGLGTDHVRVAQLRSLAESLAGGANAAEIWRRQVGHDLARDFALETALPLAGTALFSAMPPDALMEPGLL
jgi:hypothetical protein